MELKIKELRLNFPPHCLMRESLLQAWYRDSDLILFESLDNKKGAYAEQQLGLTYDDFPEHPKRLLLSFFHLILQFCFFTINWVGWWSPWAAPVRERLWPLLGFILWKCGWNKIFLPSSSLGARVEQRNVNSHSFFPTAGWTILRLSFIS